MIQYYFLGQLSGLYAEQSVTRHLNKLSLELCRHACVNNLLQLLIAAGQPTMHS